MSNTVCVLKRNRNCLPFMNTRVSPCFLVESVLLIFLVFYVIIFVLSLFWFLCQM